MWRLSMTRSATKLKGLGMNFGGIPTGPVIPRRRCGKTSFYADWKKRFGDQAWAALEKYTGKLG